MISAVGPICLFLWAKCQISMKCKVFSEWISPEAVTNGQVTEKASNSRMSILELSGEHVFLLGGVSEESCETSLLLMEGRLAFRYAENALRFLLRRTSILSLSATGGAT